VFVAQVSQQHLPRHDEQVVGDSQSIRACLAPEYVDPSVVDYLDLLRFDLHRTGL
jgi:hypothetical protein